MRCPISADVLEPVLDELPHAFLDRSRISLTSCSDLPAGSGISQSSTIVGTYGQDPPQARVIAQSAWSCISRSSFLGLRLEMSISISRMASTTSGQTASAGSWPADSARTSSGAWPSRNAWAICERPALCVQTKRTYLTRYSQVEGVLGVRGVGELAELTGDEKRRLLADVDGVIADSLQAAGDDEHAQSPLA
jgi:hypothetical protein